MLLLFSLRMRGFVRTELRTICVGKNSQVGSTKVKKARFFFSCSWAHFGWHNSLCVLKAKAFRDAKLSSYFNFLSLYNMKSPALQNKRVGVGPEKFSGLLRNGPQILQHEDKTLLFVDKSTNDFEPQTATIIDLFSYLTCLHTNTSW